GSAASSLPAMAQRAGVAAPCRRPPACFATPACALGRNGGAASRGDAGLGVLSSRALNGIFVDFIWRHGRCPCILDAITIIRAERGVSGLTDDFNAQPCRITRGTDDETDRSPACHDRKPCIRAKSFSRAKSHVAMYACL